MKKNIITIIFLALLALTATAQPMKQRVQSDACITSAETQQRKIASQIRVEVSETVELMSILARTAGNKEYNMDTLWLYSKSGPSKDKYKSLIKVATVTYEKVEKTGEILEFTVKPVE